MQHSGERALPHFLFQNARGVVVRLARMNNERQGALARRGNVRAKSVLLRLTRRIVVVIIEAGFADGDDFCSASAPYELGRRHVELLMRVVRMGAGRAIDPGEAVRYR